MSWMFAALASALIVGLALAARSLTRSGAAAAWLIGTVVFAALGAGGAAVLLVFFVSSSLVGRVVGKAQTVDAKGEQRDAAQVFANGGAAMVGALVGLMDPVLGLWLLSASLASAAADTWATSWGSGSKAPPRLILGLRTVPPGTSGGISLRGTLGGVAGAAVVAVVGAWALRGELSVWPSVALFTTIGTAGMLLDSMLGATLQGRFRCPACQLPSERRVHRCGTPTEPTGGIRWIDNDVVNALATTLTLGAAWLLYRI